MTKQAIHTILVSQDQEWVASLSTYLWQHGFAPLTIAPNAESALDLFCQAAPRLVLIDLLPSDTVALDLCTAMHAVRPEVKLVLVKESNVDVPFAALQSGVAGCIDRDLLLTAWPGLLLYILSGGMALSHNLVAMLKAAPYPSSQSQPLVLIGALRVDLFQRQVSYAGLRVDLTPREFSLLACLAHNPDRVVTFDQLLNEAWGYDANCGTPAQVRLYIARVRRKLTHDAQLPDCIHTERGLGYRLHSGTLRRATAHLERFTANGYTAHRMAAGAD